MSMCSVRIVLQIYINKDIVSHICMMLFSLFYSALVYCQILICMLNVMYHKFAYLLKRGRFLKNFEANKKKKL